MKKSSSASMYAGFPLGGRRPPVSSLGGLRNALGNETQTDGPRVAAVAAPVTRTGSPAPPVAPEDDKQILRGLNNRLNGYLDKVKHLQGANDELRGEIEEILAQRKAPKGRDWDETQKILEDLRQKIKDITMDNANLLMDANNAKMANNDLQNKLDGEINAQKVLEKELEDMKKVVDETQLQKENTKQETDMVMDEINRIQKEHEEMVDVLCDNIRTSKVKVEIEPDSNNLTSTLINIRCQYDKIAEKNLKETDDWYRNKFEDIKVVEAQNTEALESGNTELKDKQKQKQQLELTIQSLLGKIKTLEGILKDTRTECSNRLGSFNYLVQNLESEIKKVRSQMERQTEANRDLVSVKMKLEQEIGTYHELMNKVSSDQSWGLSLPDAVNIETPDDDEVVQQQQQKKLWNKEEFSSVELATTTN